MCSNELLVEMDQILNHTSLDQTVDKELLIHLPKTMGTGSIKRTKIKEGMEIIISDLELAHTLTVHIDKGHDLFELNYCLSGEAVCTTNEQQLDISKAIGNAAYFHGTTVQLETQVHSRNHMVEIRMSPQRLIAYFEGAEAQENILEILAQQKGKIKSYQMTPLIQKRIYEILHCPYKGAMKKIFLEAKAMELITLYFQEEIFCATLPAEALPAKEIERLVRAREIVLNHLDNPYSLKELAKKVELNELKLKNGFKQLFGTTVFGLIRQRKMEKAAWLLKVKGLNVSEAATVLGYSNFSNFTVAFRKHFGCNPSEYARSDQ